MLVMSAASRVRRVLARLRRRSRDARWTWAFLFVLIVGGSVVAPLAVRGPGGRRLLDAHPLEAPLDVDDRRTAGAGHHPRDRRRHRSISSRAPPPKGGCRISAASSTPAPSRIWRPSIRRRRRRCGRRSRPGSCRRRTACGRRAATAFRRRRPMQLLPDYCFAHVLVRFGFLVGAAVHVGDAQDAHAVEHPQRRRASRSAWSAGR